MLLIASKLFGRKQGKLAANSVIGVSEARKTNALNLRIKAFLVVPTVEPRFDREVFRCVIDVQNDVESFAAQTKQIDAEAGEEEII